MKAISNSRWAALLACCSLLIILTACETVNSLTGGGASGGSAPVTILQASPRDVVNAFFNAWSTRDYDAMYSRISSRSQQLITLPVFREVYTQVDDTILNTGVTINILDEEEQGTSAVITLDVNIASSLFGTIPDPERTIRLVRESAGGEWRIAWSQMDIFDGYAPGTRLEVASTRAPRGHIYDRSGIYLVEQGGTVVELYVTIASIPDYFGCANLLATLTLREVEDVIAIFDDYNADTTFSIGDIDQATYDTNAPLLAELCNIGTGTRQTRRYANHGMAAHVIGYIGQIPAEEANDFLQRGYNPGDLVGIAGVERAYERELAGSAERILRVIEPGGLVVRELGGATGSPPTDVTLTLDYNVQRAAMQALTDAFNTSCAFNLEIEAGGNWGCRSPGGSVVVLDVNSGAILGMASFPTFDPSAFAPDTSIFQGQYINQISTDPQLPQRNRATQDQYSPGSTFKIITTVAAAAERLFSPTEFFECTMEWQGQQFGDTQPVRFDWRNFELEENRFPTGQVTMAEALASSCNPFFYQMGAELYRREPTALISYARRMGLGSPTGLNPAIFPAEASGQIAAPGAADQNISIAIGQQDTQVSVIQMARMVSAVANGGILYRPYVVAQVGGTRGDAITFTGEPEVMGQLGINQTVLDVVREGMCMVTVSETENRTNGLPFGTAWFVFDNEDFPATYTVCGKTGTAQTGRIEPHGWFVAYAPADDPQIAVAAVIENSREGSETAAPIIRRIMDAYFGVTPAPFPGWWSEFAYVELQIPQGSTGG